MKTNYQIRDDFPFFRNFNGAYLDNAATTQKPKVVLSAVNNFYKKYNSNVHRGTYKISEKAEKLYSDARQTVADFLGAKSTDEIVFTKNTTESLNLIAYSYGLSNISSGDNIVLSIMEHHSNLVPWQMVAKTKNANLKYMYIDKNYSISDSELNKIDSKTKVVAITCASNVLGTVVDVKKIIKKAHSVGAIVVLDATQFVAHYKLDVTALDADFAVISGHKLYAPLGIGVLYGKKQLLKQMNPFIMGGGMIEYVTESTTTFAPLPNKFEGGTPNVAGAIGLASAIKYILSIGYDNIYKIESELTNYAIERLKKLSYVKLYLPKTNYSDVISFNIKGLHPHDVASLLSSKDICMRSGNHCAQPLMNYLSVDSTCRISIAIYNTKEEIDMFIDAVESIYNKFKKYIKD